MLDNRLAPYAYTRNFDHAAEASRWAVAKAYDLFKCSGELRLADSRADETELIWRASPYHDWATLGVVTFEQIDTEGNDHA